MRGRGSYEKESFRRGSEEVELGRGITTYIMGNESLKSKRWSLPLYLFCVRIRSRYLWLAIFSMLITSLILGTVLGLAAAKGKEVKNDGLTVDLGYAKYQGMSLTNIHQFLGIRFAAPPTGDLRFRGPKPPLDESKKGVQQANKVCILEPCLSYFSFSSAL